MERKDNGMTNLEIFLIVACASLLAVTMLTIWGWRVLYKDYRNLKREVFNATKECNNLRFDNEELKDGIKELITIKEKHQRLLLYIAERIETASSHETQSAYLIMREACKRILNQQNNY